MTPLASTVPSRRARIVVGISGASGAVLSIRVLELLATVPNVEIELVVSSAGALTLKQEAGLRVADLCTDRVTLHRNTDVGASIASGSYPTDGMLVVPCSVKTLSAIANCYSDTLLTRAADVTLKEGRPLVLAFREAPLHAGHIRLMQQATEMGAVIMPPVPAFYQKPGTVEEMVDQLARRLLDRLGLVNVGHAVWNGLHGDAGRREEGPLS